MFWFIVLFIAAFVIAYSASPKPTTTTLGTITAPTAEAGRPIPVLFGTRWVNQSNVVWYGDIDTVSTQSIGGAK